MKRGVAFVLCPALGNCFWLGLWQAASAGLGQGPPAQDEGFDPAKLRDITGIERTIGPAPGSEWWIWAGLVLAIAISIIVAALLIRRFRKRPRRLQSPSDWALAELARIE